MTDILKGFIYPSVMRAEQAGQAGIYLIQTLI